MTFFACLWAYLRRAGNRVVVDANPMTNHLGLLVTLGVMTIAACGGPPFYGASADDGAAGIITVAMAGAAGLHTTREDSAGSPTGGTTPAAAGAQGNAAGSGGSGPVDGADAGGVAAAGSGGSGPSVAGGGSGSVAGGGGGTGGVSSAGTGGVAASGGSSSAGAGGVAPAGPKRVTVIGLFGGQNALGSTGPLPSAGQYYWPDNRVSEWTEYEDGAPLGPTAAGEDSLLVTSGAELQLGSDAAVSMPYAGTVAIVKFCRTKTLIADWTKGPATLPWLADYLSVLQQAGVEIHKKYPNAVIKYAHVFMLGEYDAQMGIAVDPVALAATIRTLNAALLGQFPGSFVVATEPNLALSAWWPENAHVRQAFEAIVDDSFALVNTDAIPPANASAHDPGFDVGQELNVGSRIEYAIQRKIEALWGSPG